MAGVVKLEWILSAVRPQVHLRSMESAIDIAFPVWKSSPDVERAAKSGKPKERLRAELSESMQSVSRMRNCVVRDIAAACRHEDLCPKKLRTLMGLLQLHRELEERYKRLARSYKLANFWCRDRTPE